MVSLNRLHLRVRLGSQYRTQVESEWKIFRRIMFTNYSDCSYSAVLGNLLTNSTLKAGFPNLGYLATIALVVPVTTATVERRKKV